MAEQNSALDRMETPPFWLPTTLLRSAQIHLHVIIFFASGIRHCQLTQIIATLVARTQAVDVTSQMKIGARMLQGQAHM
jgi:hypothetical protein